MGNLKNKKKFGFEEFKSILKSIPIQNPEKKIKIGFVSHNGSDSDGVGSMFLLEKLIKSHFESIETQIIVDTDLMPDVVKIFNKFENEFNYKLPENFEGSLPDLLIYVDCQPESERIILPESWKNLDIPTIVLDHHDGSLSEKTQGIIDFENYKSCVSLVMDNFYVDEELSNGLAIMCAEGIKRDTSRFKYISETDRDAYTKLLKFVDLSTFESLEDLSLTSSQLNIYASGLKHCVTIKDICKFSFIPEIATGDEHIAITYVADFLLKNTRPTDIGNSIVAVIESKDDAKFISVSIRGNNSQKVAKELFNGNGRHDMAGAQIYIPKLFDKALTTAYFRDLVQSELNSRIINSYLNKSHEGKEEPKKSVEEIKDTPLEEKLSDSEISLDNLVLSARGMEFCSVRENTVSYFVHTNLEQAYGGAINEDQLNVMANLLSQLRKIKSNEAAITYSLIRGPSNMYVLSLIATKEGGRYSDEIIAKELFGETVENDYPKKHNIQKPIIFQQKIGDFLAVQVDLSNLIQYTWRNDNLSRCVFMGIEEKLESMFNQDDAETVYRAWKGRHNGDIVVKKKE